MNRFLSKALLILFIPLNLSADILVEEYAPDFDEIYDVYDNNSFSHQKKIERDQFHISGQLGDTLQQNKGIQLYQSGGLGKQSSFFLRGGRRGDHGIFLNGVLIQDPLDINRSIDIGSFSSDLFDEIEIYQGSHNPLYSDNTLSGAINLKTNWTTPNHIKATVAEKNTQALKGQFKQGNFLFKGSKITSDNISSANERTNDFAEADSFERYSLYIEYRKKLSKKLKLKAFVFSQTIQNEIDQTNFSTGIPYDKISDDLSTQKLNVFSSQLNYRMNSKNQLDMIANFKESDRLSSNNTYKGNVPEAILRYHLFPTDSQIFTVTLKTQREKAVTGSSIGSRYLQQYQVGAVHHIESKNLKIQTGITSLKYEGFDNEIQYQLNTKYNLSNKLSVQYMYSRNIKFPSLYQLYAPGSASYPIGNFALKPEEVKGHDVNINFAKIFNLNIFHQKYRDLIDYESATGYQNSDFAKIYGLSPEVKFQSKWINSSTSLHLLRTEVNQERTYLNRRPRISAMQGIDFKFSQSDFLNYQFEYVGERNDSGRMPSYQLHHMKYTRSFSESKSSLQVKLINLLDQDYEQTRGFGTFGRTLWVSAQKEF
jgi:vitamin B12 transporter